MTNGRGLHLERVMIDGLRKDGWVITYNEWEDIHSSVDGTARVYRRIPLPTDLKIEITFLTSDPRKYSHFLSCARKERKRYAKDSHKNHKPTPARLFIGFEYFDADVQRMVQAAVWAVRSRFLNLKPLPGVIYTLIVAKDGGYLWESNPFNYLKALIARHKSELSSTERIVGRVKETNGSGFMIETHQGIYFAYYRSICGRCPGGKPRINDLATCFPTSDFHSGMKIASAVQVEKAPRT